VDVFHDSSAVSDLPLPMIAGSHPLDRMGAG
jgi:hypothetical protein